LDADLGIAHRLAELVDHATGDLEVRVGRLRRLLVWLLRLLWYGLVRWRRWCVRLRHRLRGTEANDRDDKLPHGAEHSNSRARSIGRISRSGITKLHGCPTGEAKPTSNRSLHDYARRSTHSPSETYRPSGSPSSSR